MIVVKLGPSLSDLRRKIGTKNTVQFTVRDGRSVNMRVDALCAAGCDELPIDLPDRVSADLANAWYIAGTTEDLHQEGYDPRAICVAVFDTRGRMTIAVLAIAITEDKSAEAAVASMLEKAFTTLLLDSLRPLPD